ncbi:hypothetical protein [Nocardioides sp. SYSU D00065]|uniref:hypothetical protein n=1 Tax=Nocardioides sp. SYSU D00065 TaxID=2817378 RepID=UPI001B30328A|nr:hypothetical protein [Nocardioides sp. SYSU D00065]
MSTLTQTPGADHARGDRPLLVRLGVVLAAYLVAGAGAGVLWERLWEPPAGLTYQGRWFLEPAGPDVSFASIALFVVIAFPLGLGLALAAGTRRGDELATVVAVLLAAVVAAVVMYAVGRALGPGDPQALAAGEPDYTPISGELGLTAPDPERVGWHSTALLAFPAGAMTGLVISYLLITRRFAARPRG